MRIKFKWLQALGLLVILSWHCADNPFEPAETGTHDVAIFSDRFEPSSVEITVGEKVRWTNKDSKTHSVDSGTLGNPTSAFIGSGNLDPDATFTLTFSISGNFPYYCSLHQTGNVKQGIIIVN
ncbi:MAG: cupredoxin domain-containing protein [bacterium]